MEGTASGDRAGKKEKRGSIPLNLTDSRKVERMPSGLNRFSNKDRTRGRIRNGGIRAIFISMRERRVKTSFLSPLQVEYKLKVSRLII